MSYRSSSIILAAFWIGVGCAQAEQPPEQGQGGEAPTGLAAYSHRRVVKLSPSTPVDFAIAFEIDHASLVADGRSFADGRDLRVAYETDGDSREIDRILDTATSWDAGRTVVWFRTQGDGTHFVYYGEDEPLDVMADPAQVFDAYEAFDGSELPDDWNVLEIGTASGSANVADGVVELSGAAGDIAAASDDLLLLAKSVTGDFVFDVSIRGISGSLGGGAKAGGLMVRQSPLQDARFTMIGLADTPRERFTATRAVDGENVSTLSTDLADSFPQLFSVQRVGSTFSLLYSEDAITWVSFGEVATVEMIDPVLLGFPLANLSAGTARIEIDYLRMRTMVLPTPTAELGTEEELNPPSPE